MSLTVVCMLVASLPIHAGVEIGVLVSRSQDFELFDGLDAANGAGLTARWYFRDRQSAELTIARFESRISEPGVFGQRLGSLRWYPMSISANVHFRPSGRFHPYVGTGLVYVLSDSNGVVDARDRLSLTPALGATFDLGSRWRLSVDLRQVRLHRSRQVITSLGLRFRPE